MIILASINSTASVGLQPILAQAYISGLTCFIGMIMGILGAIELYLGIQRSMELELKQSKEFYTLAIEIYKMSQLKPEHRGEEGKDYLNKKYSVYTKLCEASNLLKRTLTVDLLTTIPTKYIDITRGVTPVEITRPDGSKHIVLEKNRSWIDYIKCCYKKYNNPADFIDDNNLHSYEFSNNIGPYVPESPLESSLESPLESPTSLFFHKPLFYKEPNRDVENQYSELNNRVIQTVYNVPNNLTEQANTVIEKQANTVIEEQANTVIEEPANTVIEEPANTITEEPANTVIEEPNK
jgi:hypothetical protein